MRKKERIIIMHNICYREYPESTPKQKIVDEVLKIVSRSGDGYGTDRITFRDVVCDNISAAQAYINDNDNAFYGGLAVKYYDFSNVKDNKKVDDLEKKIAETREKKSAFAVAHSVKSQKAAYIGCPKCGSKLSRERLRGNSCPLCSQELRAPSTLERLKSYDNRISEYEKQIAQERLKNKQKAKVMWLVKFEYHS